MRFRLTKWFFVSAFIYTIIKIIEYATGQSGTPIWAVDFFMILMPLIFIIFDNVFLPKQIKEQNK